MNQSQSISIYSEIGKLKKVLVHCPGGEVENKDPTLYNAIIYKEQAVREHNQFTQILKNEGVEVLYLTDLMADILEDQKIREKFLREFMTESNTVTGRIQDAVMQLLEGYSPKELISKCIEGIRKDELTTIKSKHLGDIMKTPHPYYMDPISNLYFQRDPNSAIGQGVSLNVMADPTRNIESLFEKYILDYHKDFKGIEQWYNRENVHPIEGGDILILSDKIVAIGLSIRTHPRAIEVFAEKLLRSNESFETVLAFDIPKKNYYIHLDTVFTMVDYDQFILYKDIEDYIDVYSIKKGSGNELDITYEQGDLKGILKKYLNISGVNIIECGGGDIVSSTREQRTDGTNTLALAPGKVICYNRNTRSNEALRKNNIEVLEIESYELTRGGGGPRCMSMPLVREKLD